MTRKEECRHAVLDFLAERPRLAHCVSAIRRGVNRIGNDFKDEEIAEAAELLTGLKLAECKLDALGSTRYYQATSEGVIQSERAQG